MTQAKNDSNNAKPGLNGIKKVISEAAVSLAKDIDHAKDKAVHEIREGFDVVSTKAKMARRAAVDATESVKDSIAERQPVELLRELVDDVEGVADGLIEGISAKFNQIREAVVTPPPVKKKARKTASRKRAISGKAGTGKKVAGIKKVPQKGPGVKTAAPKKKPAAKTAASKKKAAVKKATTNRSAVKKTASGKKPAIRNDPVVKS